MSREQNTVLIKVVEDDDGWHVFTSRNDNGFWAVGVPFESRERAARVALVIGFEARAQGDRVEQI